MPLISFFYMDIPTSPIEAVFYLPFLGGTIMADYLIKLVF
jgi:hypothetical protein